jgi:hypothetical protein
VPSSSGLWLQQDLGRGFRGALPPLRWNPPYRLEHHRALCQRGVFDSDRGDGRPAEEFEASVEQLAKHTRLRWALTLCSVQGRSLQGTIAVHDVGSVHFSQTHLYVALSRATDGALVSIAE